MKTFVDGQLLTAADINDHLAPANDVPSGESVYDTGWVNIGYQSGYSGGSTPGQLQYRRVGKTVHLRGGASGSFSAGSLIRVNADLLPASCRPSTPHRVGSFGTGVRDTAIEIRTDGEIQLGAKNGISGVGWVSACTSWLVD